MQTATTARKTGSKDVLDRNFVDQWADRYTAAWRQHDVKAILDLCQEDVSWDDPALPQPLKGHCAVRGFLEASFAAFPDFAARTTGTHLIAPDAPRVVSPFEIEGTMLGDWKLFGFAATGAHFRIAGWDEWVFGGERLVQVRTCYDTLGVARQLGLLPPAGSRMERQMARMQHVQAWFQRRRNLGGAGRNS
jgi:steroid delta-isomerase-like uncharacterized protein